jgi:hypothetical protein
LDVSESATSAEFSTCTPNAPQPATYPSKQVTRQKPPNLRML